MECEFARANWGSVAGVIIRCVTGRMKWEVGKVVKKMFLKQYRVRAFQELLKGGGVKS